MEGTYKSENRFLEVTSWKKNEGSNPKQDGRKLWHRAMPNDVKKIDLKGAFINPSNGESHVPENKKNRSQELHEYGFT